MKMLKEFREFAMRGNVMDLAVGVIIGAAFTKIVTSLVDNILTPLIGLLLGKKGLAAYQVAIGDTAITYGAFIQSILDFIIVAFVVFLLVKTMNRLQRPAQEAETASQMKDCPRCLSSIPLLATRCPHCTSEMTASPA
jgi:large conductance mechanosensitive channel